MLNGRMEEANTSVGIKFYVTGLHIFFMYLCRYLVIYEVIIQLIYQSNDVIQTKSYSLVDKNALL